MLVRPEKIDHHVFAKSFLIFLNALAEAFAGGNHHRDGNNSPGDAEHGQHRSPLVSPQRRQRIFQQIFKDTELARIRYCKMTCCFSLSPASTSVFTPLEIPSFTAVFFFPFSPLASGISTCALRSLS